jgi:hypothetical protein
MDARLLIWREFCLAEIILHFLIEDESLAFISFEGDSICFRRYFAAIIVENNVFIEYILVLYVIAISIFIF